MPTDISAQIHGVLPVEKEPGMSTFDCIRIFNKYANLPKKQKVGHAGTLDVFADGVVLLLLGDMTKSFDSFQEWSKEYVAGVRMGYGSNTLDIEGELSKQDILPETRIEKKQLQEIAKSFAGSYSQKIPDYSAAKQDGEARYKAARSGKTLDEKTKEVSIHEITVCEYLYPIATIRVSCGSGTYIRQLTKDIFDKAGYDSFLWYLRRTRIGDIGLDDCARLSDIKENTWEQFLFTQSE